MTRRAQDKARKVFKKNGNTIVCWLAAKNITELQSEHIVSGFYLVKIKDASFRAHDAFTDMEVRNTLATSLAIGKGQIKIDPVLLPDRSVEKVRIAIK